MASSKPPRRGQRVRILTCKHDLAEHVGQVGVVASSRPGQISVFVNGGLCRATEVDLPNIEEVGDADDQGTFAAARRSPN